MTKTLYLILGYLALGLGAVGFVMPIMPTVPFLIVAVWCFSKSSPRLQAKILRNRQVGPLIRDWLRRGAIPTRVKWVSVAAMACGVTFAVLASLPVWLVAGQATICAAVAIYVITRPAA